MVDIIYIFRYLYYVHEQMARMYAHHSFACAYPLYIMPAPIAYVAHILYVTFIGTEINKYQVKYLV